ncbi:YadA-like family protein [Burkholderia sp. BCC0419]|uniref:YadA-like family protein n=1 Tax=Burkholderia sp. BCC0419 TaxID=486878 RepID=UPI001FC8D569|nr:YadA-like family protein [Burkholderia sp. BCC0419]
MGEKSIAIGSSASTRPSPTGLGGAVAIGGAATAAGNNVALGASASALGDEGAIALGAGANAGGKSSIALGNEAQATGWGAYALGRKAKATAESSLAIGDSSMATRQGTMAIGAQAAAAAENAIAIGQSAAARGADSLALGSYSETDRNLTVSVGTAGFERQIVNVGRGTQATDAVNVAQLKGVTDVLGGNATVGADGNIKKPTYTIGSKTYDNVGDALLAASTSGGGSANAVEYDSDAKSSVTLGGTGSAAVKLTNVRAATLSSNSTDAVNGAQLFATNNRVTNVEQSLNDSGLIDPSTGESLAVTYTNATKSTVSLGGMGGTVVTNVKAGKVMSASKDAVNGGQLYDVSSSVASALGGASTVNSDGTVSKPTYQVGDKTYNNVGDALQAAAATGGAGGGEDANAVHYDSANKSSVTLGGTGTTKPVALKNVATGTAGTDAVNVAQLQSGLSDVKDEIKQDLGNGTLDMKYIKVRATGMQASALGKNSVAIGSQASATNVDTLAIGSGSRASGMNSVAIGINSVATGANTVSVGDTGATRRLVNVGDGVDGTDAVTMKQLADAMRTTNTQLDKRMMRMTRDVESKPGSFVAIEGLGADGSMPNIASMNGRDPSLGTSAAIGVGSGAGGINSIAVGLQAVASSDYAVAIGSIAQTGVDHPYSVAMGSMVTTNGPGALAIGSRAKANAENAVAVGNNGVTAVGKSSIAIGDKALAAAGTVNSVAMGKSANIAQNVTDAIALGANASVKSGNNAGIALGANSIAERGNALSVGSNSLQRQIVNVAKGTQNNDAVNVSQLTGVTNALGGGAGIDTDGSIKAPTYKVGDTMYNNVGDALDAMAKSGGSDPNAVAYDTDTKDKVTLAGTAGTTLTNVKAGALSATSTDAVNGSQLFATNENLGNLKDTLTDGGVIDKTTGESLAVVYDSTSKDKVTLAGKTGTTLSNVAAGKADLDAVNVSQLKSSGLIGEDGKSVAAVTYDKNADGTPNYKSVKLAGTGGTTLSNVAAGKADMDAVNVSQLKSSGLVGEDGKSVAAVTYDKNADGTPNYKSVKLAGEGGTTLSNVKAGELSSTSMDAVNGSQLFATNENLGNLKDTLTDGGVIDKTTGESLAVVYDSTSKDKVTLAGKTGTTLSNVAAGKADLDAVNVSQLKSSGLIGEDGKSIAAVTYDKNADGTANFNSVTLGGGKSAGPVTLSNVAKGKTGTDAVNVDQLTDAIRNVEGGLNPLSVSYDSAAKDKVTLTGKTGTTLTNLNAGTVSVDSKDAVNGSQLYGTAKSVADALGGGSTVDENGKVKAPTYSLTDPAGGSKQVDYHTVGDALENLDGRVASNTGDITNINNQFTNTGLVDGNGDTRAAVTYDKNADGTPSYKSATLAGAGGTTLSNVAAGKADLDAVNVSQLKSSGLIGEDGKSVAAVTYDKNADGTTNYKSVKLAGEGGTKLSNVKAGELSSTSTDAVNGSQLFATNESLGNLKDTLTDGGVIDKTTGESLAVVYDSTSKDKVTLAGKTGTTLSNVAAGKADLDAVNVSQLKSSGLIGEDGKSIAAVTYDKNADGTANFNSVTLGGGKSTGPVTLSNVAKGKAGTDAVNVDQLNDLEDSLVNGAVRLKYIKVNSDGREAIARGPESVAIGANAWATRPQTMALGSGSRANGLNSVAIGYNSIADDDNTVAVGSVGEERRIVHVAAGNVGADSTDAVNGSQLHAALDKLNANVSAQEKRLMTLKQTRDVESKPGSFVAIEGLGADGSMPNIASMNGRDPKMGTSAAIGVGSGSSGINAIAVGLQAVANSDQSVAIGSIAQTGVDHPYSVAMGSMVTTNGPGALAIGSRAKANAENAVAVGNNGVMAVGKSSIAIGDKAVTMSGAVNSIAVGTNANVARNVADAVALGANSKAIQSNSIALGAGSLADRANALSIGTAGAERQIVNVAKGTQNTDAVNLAQLKGLAEVVGGGTGFDANGDVTAPTYKIDGKEYHNVNDALQAAAKSGSDGGNGTDPNAVAYDGAQKDSVTLAGQNGTTLSNVKAGTADTDAVNVSQLKSSGLIDKDGNAVAAMTYDKNADGTPNFKSATLAGEGGTTLSNVASGKSDTDAVNVSQLKSSGLIGESGKSLAAVTYDTHADGTTNFASVTFGGMNAGIPVALHNIAAGKTSTDAVNVSQLKGVTDAIGGGSGIDPDGKVTAPVYTVDGTDYASVGDAIKALEKRDGGSGSGTNSNAVVYDNATQAAVTLAGAKGTVIRNVADGSLALDSTEAVNGGQLNFAVSSIADSLGGGAKFDPVTGDISAPTYELTAADGLKNTYDNVGDAFKHVDERTTANTTQIGTLQKGLANAVQYDDDAHTSITLGGTGAAPVKLKNVADGTEETDAVNVRQLRSAGLVGEDGKLQSAVVYDKNADNTTNYGSVTLGGKDAAGPVALHNVAAGTAKTDAVNVSQLSGVTDALGGGAKVDDKTGEIVAPTYKVGGDSFHNAGDALTNIDNRVTQIQSNLGEATKLVGAVAYDKNGDGTVNWGKVTLGNGLSTGPVVLTNVADGRSQYDAVNYGQFSKLEGRVNNIDERLNVAITPGGGNDGNSGKNGNDLISGTGGSGKDSAEIVAAKPGTGNGNIAVGSGSQIADAKNNGTAVGAGSKVQADGGTALGQGATVSSGATNSVALGSGSKATEANTVSVGSAGNERRIVNIADGVKATDAVSKGQFDRALGGMQGQINDISRNAYSGIAGATALTMIPGVDPGKTLSFGVAGASFKGYQAVAMGGEARITENLKMRAGVSLSGGGNTFGAGASYQW